VKPKTLRSILIRFSVVGFFFALSMALPTGVIVLFVQGRGVTLVEIGVLVAISAITVVLFELPTGGLADVWGRKKVLLASSAAGIASTVVLLASFSFSTMAFAMVLLGVNLALFSGTAEALLVDSLKEADPEVNLQRTMSTMMMMQGFGMALGAVLGGFIPRWFQDLPAEGTAVFTPLAMPIATAMGVSFVALFCTATLLHEPAVARPHSASDLRGMKAITDVIRQALVLVSKDRLILLLMSAAALYSVSFAPVEFFWQPHFANLQESLTGVAQTDTRAFGFIAAMLYVFSGVGAGLAGLTSRWTGKRYTLACAAAMALLAGVLVIYSLQTGWYAAVAGFWVVYMFSGLGVAVFQPLVNSVIPSDKRATLISFQSLAMKAGLFLSAPSLGFVAQRYSIPLACRWGAALMMFTVPLLLYADRLHAPLREAEEAAEGASSEEEPAGSATGSAGI